MPPHSNSPENSIFFLHNKGSDFIGFPAQAQEPQGAQSKAGGYTSPGFSVSSLSPKELSIMFVHNFLGIRGSLLSNIVSLVNIVNAEHIIYHFFVRKNLM